MQQHSVYFYFHVLASTLCDHVITRMTFDRCCFHSTSEIIRKLLFYLNYDSETGF